MFGMHPSLALEGAKSELLHPGFELMTFSVRERAANQLSQSEVFVQEQYKFSRGREQTMDSPAGLGLLVRRA